MKQRVCNINLKSATLFTGWTVAWLSLGTGIGVIWFYIYDAMDATNYKPGKALAIRRILMCSLLFISSVNLIIGVKKSKPQMMCQWLLVTSVIFILAVIYFCLNVFVYGYSYNSFQNWTLVISAGLCCSSGFIVYGYRNELLEKQKSDNMSFETS